MLMFPVLFLALIVSGFMTHNMVKQQKKLHTPASSIGTGDMYLESNPFVVTNSQDRFVNTHTTRTKISSNTNVNHKNGGIGGIGGGIGGHGGRGGRPHGGGPRGGGPRGGGGRGGRR